MKQFIFNCTIIIFFLYSCKNTESNVDYLPFVDVEKQDITIVIDSAKFTSNSVLDYLLNVDYKDEYSGSFKRYFENKDSSKSLDEWIDFDSLNRVNSIHTCIVNWKYSGNEKILIEGKLFSSLKFDEAFFLIAFDTTIVAFNKLDSQLGFQEQYSKSELEKIKYIDIELLTFKQNNEDTSIISQSIYKKYKIVNSLPVEILVTKKDMFESEKYDFVRKRYNL